jgi:hypothetical protein
MKTSKRAYAIVKGIKTNVELITSVQNLLDHIQHLESEWDTNNLWFRGLSQEETSGTFMQSVPGVTKYKSLINPIRTY